MIGVGCAYVITHILTKGGNMEKICGTCAHADHGVCYNCSGVDGVTEIGTNFTCENWEAPYLTCDRCMDKATCPYAGDDPFNMNGECLAMK
jgi:hypothetical protein